MSENEIKKVENKEKSLEETTDEISSKIAIDAMKKYEEMMLEKNDEKKSSMKEFTSKKDVDKKTSDGSIEGMGEKEKVFTFLKALVTDDQPTVKMFNERARQKALSEGVAAAGGNLIPQEMHELILKDLNAPHRQRSLVKNVKMRTHTRTFNVEANTVQIYATGETATKTTTTATWDRDTIVAYKMAAILNISDELMADSVMFDIVDEIIPQFAEAIGNMEDRWITQGTGVGQPTGYITAAPPAVACAGGGITFLDLKNVLYALPAQYRRNAVWQIHNQNIRKIASIRDTVGRFIYHEDVTTGGPSTLEGLPVIENNMMPANQILIGDLKHGYYFGDRQSMTVKTNDRDTESWYKDMTSIRVVERIGGDLLILNSCRRLTGVS